MQQVANFEINYFQLLSENGVFTGNLLEIFTDCTDQKMLFNKILKLYTFMMQTRLFDAKAINLQRTGKLGTYPSCLWHEAIGVGIGNSMQANDIFCPYYRDLGTMLWRGVLMEEILAYWGGYPNGNNFSNNVQDFPFCVPIASQTLHAVGAAFAIKYKKLPQVVVTTIGDGGTSRGDFYEALNIAKLWDLPIVFIIINNKWAISTPVHMQTQSATLAQKGIAAGIIGEQVDGNDLFALIYRLDKLVQNARRGAGPGLIEAITYRMNDHTTADDASRYRSIEEKEQHLVTDPLLRLKIFLQKKFNFAEEQDLKIIAQCQMLIELAVSNYFKACT